MTQATPYWNDILAAVLIFITEFVGLIVYSMFLLAVFSKKEPSTEPKVSFFVKPNYSSRGRSGDYFSEVGKDHKLRF